MLSGANVFGVGEWPMRWVWIGGWVGRRFEGWKFRLGRCIYSYTTSRAKESAGREIRVRSFGWPCEVGICAYTWQSLHVTYRRGISAPILSTFGCWDILMPTSCIVVGCDTCVFFEGYMLNPDKGMFTKRVIKLWVGRTY
jgi:hypothetical protein